VKLVTTQQMRDLERRAVDAGTTFDALMDEAGLAVAQEAWLMLGMTPGRRVLVLAGPGNNGGDGLVAARHLADWGADVLVYLLAPRAEDDRRIADVRERDVPVHVTTDDDGYRTLDAALDGAHLVVDALLGTGRSRPVEGTLAELLRRLAAARERRDAPQVVAVDVPTAVDADSGAADDLAVRADLTVTFGFAKTGLYMLPGAEHTGRIEVIDIGLPKDAAAELPVDLLDRTGVLERLPERTKGGNKGTFGRVLVAGGSRNYVGAARLAAEGCYRTGAGLVTVACPASVHPMIATALAETTFVPLAERDGGLAPGAADAVLEQLGAYDVLLIGPGLSQESGVAEFVLGVLSEAGGELRALIDADGLNALAATDGWPARVRPASVLTPHPGEMARLAGIDVPSVQRDRLGCATRAAAEWKQTIVLKGAHTVVAAPDGRAAVSPYANPLLATAGTGDVLAGAIAGLLAQGVEPFEAACGGVYLHGLAAEELRDEYGDRGMLAGELLPALPRAVRLVREGRPMRPSGGMAGLPDLASMGLQAPPDM
jgi:ADP-dependent NAD(P)H-hydrate dehydratase / NAD(P)H-hydrate epimerase